MTKEEIIPPSILFANTFNWKSEMKAERRRSKETYYAEQVLEFFTLLKFDVKNDNNIVVAKFENIVVEFSYRETAKNVYKHLKITNNGKKSNITIIKHFWDKTKKRKVTIKKLLEK